MAPHFSIFLPVWNGATWIGGAIESVLAQTYPAWELIIADNVSTVNLAEVVERYDDPRIRFHRWSTHTDVCENFNRTVLLARYEWLQPFSADDRLDPTCLEVLANRIREVSDPTVRLAAVLTAARRVDPQGRPADRLYYGYRGRADIPDGLHDGASWYHHALLGVTPWNMGSAVLSRDVLGEMGGLLRAEIGLCADIELMLRLAAYGQVLYVDQPLLDFTVRRDADSQSRGFSPRAWDRDLAPLAAALISGLKVHQERRVVSREERAAVYAVIARTQIQRAFQHRYCQGGRGRAGAFREVLRALSWSPATVLRPKNLIYALSAIFSPLRVIQRARAAVDPTRRESLPGMGALFLR